MIKHLRFNTNKYFGEYEAKMGKALKKNDISLKSYDILLITGHKAI